MLPLTAAVREGGHLSIGGCDLAELAEQHGTPLYVYDETTLRAACRDWMGALRPAYPNSRLLYAAKAFFNLALAGLLREEGLGIDVASQGELEAALAAGFPPEQVTLHGNNKSRSELELARRLHIGAVVIDSADELALVARLLESGDGPRLRALVRVNPNVDPHTHAYISTGTIDSKFGLSIQAGQAEDVIAAALRLEGLELTGLHFHLGSQVFSTEPYRLAVNQVLEFAARMRDGHGLQLRQFSPGGGFGVGYLGEPTPTPADFVAAIVSAVRESAVRHRLGEPELVLEAGRSIVTRAGVAVYRVGTVKRIPGVRTYLAVDGGMGDNIRPALYGARYPALLANRARDPAEEWVRVVGKYCESGDILIRRVKLPAATPGDLLAIPMSGAYAPALASNYNLSLRPAILLVCDGKARLIRRRERLEDLLRPDRELD